MDSFDNFQYDTSSTYGGLPIVDDTSSVVSGFTTNTQGTGRLPTELESLSSLSISGVPSGQQRSSKGSEEGDVIARSDAVDEELDGVLDDLKDENAVELPPHACRYANLPWLSLAYF